MAVGQRLAQEWGAGTVVALSGELGAGKTALVKGLARGLDITQTVTSPTFALIQEYRDGRLPLYHIDLYRLDSAAEAVDIGIEDYLVPDGITVIEWADKIASLLPAATRRVHLTVLGPEQRRIEIEP